MVPGPLAGGAVFCKNVKYGILKKCKIRYFGKIKNIQAGGLSGPMAGSKYFVTAGWLSGIYKNVKYGP